MKTYGGWVYRLMYSWPRHYLVSDQFHAPSALLAGKEPHWCMLDRRLGGPRNRSGEGGDEKILPLPEFEIRPLGRPAHSHSLYLLYCPSPLTIYSAFHGWGNGLLKGHRVRRFSAAIKPFAAIESAVARWYPDVNFPCLHTFIRIL
jgi:hypothetical protein